MLAVGICPPVLMQIGLSRSDLTDLTVCCGERWEVWVVNRGAVPYLSFERRLLARVVLP